VLWYLEKDGDAIGVVFNKREKKPTKKYQVQNPRDEKLVLPQTLALLKHTLAKKTPVSLCNSIKTHLLKVQRRQNKNTTA
jgi:hypothetical protein